MSEKIPYDQDGFPLTAGALTIVRDENTGAFSTSTLGVVKTEQSYNRNGRLDTLRWRIGGNITRQWSYTYNALGRIVQIVENQANSILEYRYYYTHNGQLSIVTLNGDTVSTYIYDANGNRLAHNGAMGVYDSQDRMVTYAGRSYNFDDNGSLIQVSGALHSTSFAYDLHGNLTHATLENGTEIDYEVDARNRRVGKRVNGVKVEGFLYQSQLRPIAWLDANGAIKATFVYGDRNHVPSYMTMGGVTYRLITDHLGSVRLVVNTATGAIAQEMDYDEFGNVVRNTAPGFQPFGFAGGLYDSHTGLVRFGARDYDPTTGRWTAKDPILFAGGQGNLYVYVGNDPLNKVDPQGRFAMAAPIIWGLLDGAATSAFIIGAFQSVMDWFDDADEDDDDYDDPTGGVCKMPTGGPDDDEKKRKLDNKKGDTPGNNQKQNKQFDDAVKDVEKAIGRKLRPDERRKLHDYISGKGYGFHDIVNIGIQMFGFI